MADNIYIFDKRSSIRSLLGEVQTDFNMSLVMDGTKDSMQVEVIGFDDKEVEPNSIIYHENTDTWWIVKSDKVNGYYGENGKLYIHEISLLGAIELLNARDLTDCGFKDRTYTISQFLNRLMSLSTFEYSTNFVCDSFDFNQVIDYIKTYENYSLRSALREFFDGYNCDCKMKFNTTGSGDLVSISSATIYVYPKSGRDDLDSIDISEFDETKEVKTIDRSSYGSTVISNAQNVVSTKMKYYPIHGGISLNANAHEVSATNAVLRLPSNVFDIDYVDMYFAATLKMTGYTDPIASVWAFYNSMLGTYNIIKDKLTQQYSQEVWYADMMIDFANKQADIEQRLRDFATVRFYKGPAYDAMHNKIVVPSGSDDKIYIPQVGRYDAVWLPLSVALFDKDVWDTLNSPVQGIYWERGSNIISGFNFLAKSKLGDTRRIWNKDSTLGVNHVGDYIYRYTYQGSNVVVVNYDWNLAYLTIFSTLYKVAYLPMSDLKIKVDNKVDGNDNQIYNQVGKITDSVALSKLLNSYSNEITTDKITRFMTYYDFNDIPQVGQRVRVGNLSYVINNISYNFFENEDNGSPYYISCEFTLSKQIATKSLMVNPNSDVRDYGIPQNNNVVRKQCFRDYWTFDFLVDQYADYDYYREIGDIIGFKTTSDLDLDHVAVMRIQYDDNIGSTEYGTSNVYCYQLDTFKYRLSKMSVEVLDFHDNNIIGYGSQNIFSGFNINDLLNLTDKISTPISYVDNNGRFKDIRILFANQTQINTAWANYIFSKVQRIESYTYFKYEPFVDYDLFEQITIDGYDYEIIENGYNKDALEVPFFEYIAQLGDTENVIVGDNIFNDEEVDGLNSFFMYGFVIQDTNTITNLNAFRFSNVYSSGVMTYTCSINFLGSAYMDITFYVGSTYENGEVHNSTQLPPELNKDIGIYRYLIDKDLNIVRKDLLFVIRGATSDNVVDNKLRLYINHYKLK